MNRHSTLLTGKSGRARILWVTPERTPGAQRGYRLAFAKLLHAGLIEAVSIVSPMAHNQQQGHYLDGLIENFVKFAPNIVMVEHPSDSMITAEHIHQLRRRFPFKLIVDEGDVYDRKIKKPPHALRSLVPLADVVATPGASTQFEMYRSLDAKRVEWLPTSFNPVDFGNKQIPGSGRGLKVVMIGNDSRSRIPYRSMAGSKERAKLFDLLQRRFGAQFATYGDGWSGKSAMGPIPFLEQETILQSAQISVNFDHYPNEARCFSNRLPIALASGSVHVTTWHPGYESIFPRAETESFLHFATTPEAIVSKAEQILEKYDPKAIRVAGEAARRFAFTHFRQDDLLVKTLNWVLDANNQINLADAQVAWNADVEPLDEF